MSIAWHCGLNMTSIGSLAAVILRLKVKDIPPRDLTIFHDDLRAFFLYPIMTKTVYHSLDELFSAKKANPPAEWELEDLLRDEGELFGYERFSRPQWDCDSMEDRAKPPNFGRLDNEDDASWTSRSEG